MPRAPLGTLNDILDTFNQNVSNFQAQMPDPKTYKQHFENKHPKVALPEELKAI